MDRIRIILAALAAGASDVQTDLADRLKRAFGDNTKAIRALEDYLEDPATYERPLAKALLDAKTDRDEDIVAAAQAALSVEATEPSAVLHQIAEREKLRAADRFTRRAEDISEVKAQDARASQQRMEHMWEQERQRLAQVAERQTHQRQQERRLLIGVLGIALLILAGLIVVALLTAR